MLNYFIFQLFRDDETNLSVIYTTSEAFKRMTFELRSSKQDCQKNIAKSNRKRKLRNEEK